MVALTKKDLRNYKVFDCGYCTIQNLEKAEILTQIGTNSGIYGWNWTAYRVNGTDCVLLNSYRNGLQQWHKNFVSVREDLERIDAKSVHFWKKSDDEKAEILKELQNLLNG